MPELHRTKRPVLDATETLKSVGVDPNAQPPAPVPVETAEQEPQARARRPFGVAQAKLAFPPARNGFVQYVFNDTPGRVQRAVEAGYTHRKDGDGKPYVAIVGVSQDGSGMRGYLMEIPEEWYLQDQQEKQKVNDRIDNSIRRGDIQGKVGEDGRYVPAQGIKISSSR